MSHHKVFTNFWKTFFNIKMWYLIVSKKKNPLFNYGIEKSVPRDHHLILTQTLSNNWLDLNNNPLYSDGFFHLIQYNKLGMVHSIYLGVTEYKFPTKIEFLSEDRFNLGKQCRPWWNAALWGISSGSSLFANVCKGLRIKSSCTYHQHVVLRWFLLEVCTLINLVLRYRVSFMSAQFSAGFHCNLVGIFCIKSWCAYIIES